MSPMEFCGFEKRLENRQNLNMILDGQKFLIQGAATLPTTPIR